MKRSISIMSFLRTALVSLFMGVGLAMAAGVPIVLMVVGLFLSSFLPMPNGVSLMAIQKEIWLTDIVENLYSSNPHLQFAHNADAFVLGGKVVHIPNAGASPTVTRNQSTFPVTVVTRTDVDITFSLDEFSSAPVKIANAEKYELAYDKRQSVIGQASNALAEIVGDWFFYYWSPTVSTQMVRTSGATSAAIYGTGVRKLLTVADVKAAQTLMNKNGVSQKDRYAELDADMYAQFTDDLGLTANRDFSKYFDAEKGVIGKLYSFTFLDPRSTVLRYSNAATPVPNTPGAAGANTDHSAGLFWQKDAVTRALGTNELFEDMSNPLYLGDIYAALIRAGGRKRRNDGKGVIALVQETFV